MTEQLGQIAVGGLPDLADSYTDFLLAKAPVAVAGGFDPPSAPHRSLKPHQVDIATWMTRQGQSAAFASFGLGKTRIQLQVAKWIHQHTRMKVLIVAPLGVRQEFTRNDGPAMGMKVEYCRNNEEIAAANTPYIITNYERVRDGNIDVSVFGGVLLDEASCLRNYGTKTSQMFVQLFSSIPYRFLATATPCPNDFIELINYADFLGIMDRGQAMTRWFQRDPEEAGNLQLYPHETERFWLWVATWGLFVSRPSDLGHEDEGYALPKLNVHWHPVSVSYERASEEIDKRNGQRRLLPKTSGGIQEVAKERKHTITERIAAAKAIIDQHPDDHWIVWHYLESERHAICKAIPEAVAIYGSQKLEDREDRIVDFSNGKIRVLAPKPEIAGSGCNFQKHCHRAIFVGPTDKFNDFIQAVHRIYRFLQTHDVELHIVHADTQGETVSIMKRKWRQHNELTERMQSIIRKHGLNQSGIESRLKRMNGVERQEVAGKSFRAINNDCVVEIKGWEDNSIDQIVTSIPFSDHYEYSPNFNDFGHNNGDVGFFGQMDFLVPELLRITKPGRVACIHTKDRIEYGTMTGNAMYSVNEFSDKTVASFKKHGWIYMGRIVIDTDVVRENAQTYRLGHTENGKDSTKMGCGSTEFVLLFRKWDPSMSPNDTASGPNPVTKSKDEYSRSRWQIHASGVWRSSGDELISPAMIANMSVSAIYHWWRGYCDKHGYDYPTHLQFTEACEAAGKLPASMMLFAPCGHDPNIWTDILRFKTLNSELRKKTTENHICLAEGSLVLTKDGHKMIENIEVGDLVLTHKGRWRPVIAKKCTGVNDILLVKAQGVSSLALTPTHKVWARDSRCLSHPKQVAMRATPDWKEAKDLGGCYLNLKLPPEESNDLSEQQWWLIGRWLADGHVGTRGDFYVSVGRDKDSEFHSNVGEMVGPQNDRTPAYQYRIRSKESGVYETLKQCGKGASGKFIPPVAFTLPQEQAKALLMGYLSGDGHFNADRNKWYASSVSRELLLGMKFIVQRVFNEVASIHAGREAGTAVIDGRTVNTKQEWVLSWGNVSHSFSFIADDGAWKKVKSVHSAGKATTWNIRVEEDESYTAEGCIVKNCPLQLDVIERLIERFSNPGETIFDPFGGLMSVPYQAIQMDRKGVGTELNYDYWKFGVQFCERWENEQEIPTLFDLMEEPSAEPSVV